MTDICQWCGGPKNMRNPTGECDHLYWPDNLTAEAKRANGLPVDELVSELNGVDAYKAELEAAMRDIIEHKDWTIEQMSERASQALAKKPVSF